MAHGSRKDAVHHGGPAWQKEQSAAVHIVFTVRKQREMDAGAQL